MTLVAIDDGFDFQVVVVDSAWVFRFARRRQVAEALEQEATLLPLLVDVLPVEVPRFAHVSRDPPYVMYPLIEGEPLVDEDSAGVRAFLDALHGLDVATLPMQASDWVAMYKARCAGFEELVLPRLDNEQRAKARALFDEVDSLRGFEAALVHSDLGPEHLLVRDGRLAGVIDWGDVGIGDPALDYAWLLHGPFTEWDVDEGLRRRAGFYHRLAPFYSVHYGVFTGRPDYVAEALATLAATL